MVVVLYQQQPLSSTMRCCSSSSSTLPSLLLPPSPLPLSSSSRRGRGSSIYGRQLTIRGSRTDGSLFSSSSSSLFYSSDKYKKKKKKKKPKPWSSSSSFSSFSSMKCHCHGNGGCDAAAAANDNDDDGGSKTISRRLSFSSPYEVLGVESSSSFAQIKSAFRRKVKEFHPDVCKDLKESDVMIRRVIKAYELLCQNHKREVTERENFDPFEEPECEASDLFVNETFCIGKGCPYSCVKRAPSVFSFNPETGTACATSQGFTDNYLVQLAVGQCPRRCIHYVTPTQRVVLEEMLCSILNAPYDPAEIACLESLIAKASFENNRYQQQKSQPKSTTEFVDWY